MNWKTAKRIFLCLFILALVGVLATRQDKIIIKKDDLKILHNYDLILTCGQSAQSHLVCLANLSGRTYTHIGMLVGHADSVLHATPDGTETNGIRIDALQDFIDLSDVDLYKIIRLKSLIDTALLVKHVAHYKELERPFDYDFNNKDASKLYCTELVYNIYHQSHLINTKVELNSPIYPRKFSEMNEFKTILIRSSKDN